MSIYRDTNEETRSQRFGHYFALLSIILMLALGYNLRIGALNAITPYTNNEAGIRAEYPLGWLLDTRGDYIFRVRDMARTGFKTTFQVSAYPLSRDMTARNVFDDLALRRAQTLPLYKGFGSQNIVVRGEEQAVQYEYTFVFVDPNPFVQSVPIAVIGRDILFIRSGQAIVVTLLSDSQSYTRDLMLFDNFLAALDF